MTSAIDKLRLKIRNTTRLKRNQVPMSLNEARELDKQIQELEKRIEQLESADLPTGPLTVDIVGRDF